MAGGPESASTRVYELQLEPAVLRNRVKLHPLFTPWRREGIAEEDNVPVLSRFFRGALQEASLPGYEPGETPTLSARLRLIANMAQIALESDIPEKAIAASLHAAQTDGDGNSKSNNVTDIMPAIVQAFHWLFEVSSESDETLAKLEAAASKSDKALAKFEAASEESTRFQIEVCRSIYDYATHRFRSELGLGFYEAFGAVEELHWGAIRE